VSTATVSGRGTTRVDASTRGGDFYVAVRGDIFVATRGDLELATRGDFLMAMDSGFAVGSDDGGRRPDNPSAAG
jgi:hypothetical protein